MDVVGNCHKKKPSAMIAISSSMCVLAISITPSICIRRSLDTVEGYSSPEGSFVSLNELGVALLIKQAPAYQAPRSAIYATVSCVPPTVRQGLNQREIHTHSRTITMADGQLFKPDKDFSKEADKVIPEAQELAKVAAIHQFRRITLLRCGLG